MGAGYRTTLGSAVTSARPEDHTTDRNKEARGIRDYAARFAGFGQRAAIRGRISSTRRRV